MSLTERQPKVLAIGIDAAEPSLVRRLIETGELPTLRRLLDDGGTWNQVQSSAHIGSGAVWPTFTTGRAPHEHQIHSEWSWRPESMRLAPVSNDHLVPFWKALDARGVRVGVLDVPYAPLIALNKGFEISEWGAHDPLAGRTLVSETSLNDLIAKEVGPHPFSSSDGSDTNGPDDLEGLKSLSAACLKGAEMRGRLASRLLSEIPVDLSIVVFTEIHHASHRLWHTLETDSEDQVESKPTATSGQVVRGSAPLLDIYREVDRQIGHIIATVGMNATVLVFSLHGMRPCRGIAALLEPLLLETGMAHRSNWRTQTWAQRAISTFAAVKRHTPPALKNLYYGAMSKEFVTRLAQPTMLPAYDWTRTRAFPIPTDQHGWIRLNLAGREALGTVNESEYEETCDRLEEMLRALTTRAEGRLLVKDIIRPSMENGGAPPRNLPDMVVQWTDAAFASPLRLNDRALEAAPIALKQTGQHALEGFCIINGDVPDQLHTGIIHAKDFHSMIESLLKTD